MQKKQPITHVQVSLAPVLQHLLNTKAPAARHGSAELRFVSSALPENIQRLAPSSFGSSHAQTRAYYAANHAGEDLEFSHGNQFHCGGADERRAWL